MAGVCVCVCVIDYILNSKIPFLAATWSHVCEMCIRIILENFVCIFVFLTFTLNLCVFRIGRPPKYRKNQQRDYQSECQSTTLGCDVCSIVFTQFGNRGGKNLSGFVLCIS